MGVIIIYLAYTGALQTLDIPWWILGLAAATVVIQEIEKHALRQKIKELRSI